MGVIARSGFVVLVHFLVTLSLAINSDLDKLQFVGLYVSIALVGWLSYEISSTVYDSWLGHALGKGVDFKKQGSWAVITGATDGIGLAFARELAKKGINICLISRTEEKLVRCAKSIETEYKVETKIIQIDFSNHMEQYTSLLEYELRGMDIGTLINNVGMTYNAPEIFHVVSEDEAFCNHMINLNVTAVVAMTRVVLPGMMNRGKGAVINIGSVASLYGAPFFTLYAATKAFMENFTYCLELEYKNSGITFQYQAPGYVDTKMAKARQKTIFLPTPEQYAKAALKTVGLLQGSMTWFPIRPLHFATRNLTRIVSQHHMREVLYDLLHPFWLFARKRQLEKQTGKKFQMTV